MTTKEWNTFFNGHWNFSGAKQEGHLAMFPEELPSRLIRMFSFHGETVLDPFMGSGTTALAASKLYRNSIGYEINPEFIPIIQKKIGSGDLFSEPDINIVKATETTIDFDELVDTLPYTFIDTHKLDKKIDVKQMQYGSKIDAESTTKREQFYTIKDIISPELIILNNGVTIKLIGIKENHEVNGRAIEFLWEMLKGKRVFLKFDQDKYDQENHLLAYLYLENKSFVNARLLKERLADVDKSLDYKYKKRFEAI
jgi:site-specific DNA-methyltransferase (adenine-specific)